jgi:hypothetical protein
VNIRWLTGRDAIRGADRRGVGRRDRIGGSLRVGQRAAPGNLAAAGPPPGLWPGRTIGIVILSMNCSSYWPSVLLCTVRVVLVDFQPSVDSSQLSNLPKALPVTRPKRLSWTGQAPACSPGNTTSPDCLTSMGTAMSPAFGGGITIPAHFAQTMSAAIVWNVSLNVSPPTVRSSFQTGFVVAGIRCDSEKIFAFPWPSFRSRSASRLHAETT